MSKFIRNTENFLFVIFSYGLFNFLLVICVIVALVQTCTQKPYDPLDYDHSRDRRSVFTSFVTDSLGDGFEITFRSRDSITKKELKVLQADKRIKRIEASFPTDAALRFGDIVETEIMEFARYGENYVKDDPVTVKSVYERGGRKHFLHDDPGSKLYGTKYGVDFSSIDTNFTKE